MKKYRESGWEEGGSQKRRKQLGVVRARQMSEKQRAVRGAREKRNKFNCASGCMRRVLGPADSSFRSGVQVGVKKA